MKVLLVVRGSKTIKKGLLEKDERVKKKIRDSVFTKLFRNKNNLVNLYGALKPEDKKVNADDIEIMTIELVLTDGMYNDLGFSIKGEDGKVEKIILVEAQTKWDKNMAERMSVYAQKTREMYWENNGEDYHSSKKMNTPVFEHYVIYTGNGGDKDKYMLLHDCVVPKQSMNLGIKIITDVDASVCGQYIGFCKVYSDCLKKYKGDKSKVLYETINTCNEKGYLVEFLRENLWEVKDIMGIFMDQAMAVEHYGKEQRKEGEIRGIAIGEKKGIAIGEKRGEKKGIEKAISIFLAKDKERMEAAAEEFDMTISEYIDMCAQSMKMEREDLIKMCAKSMRMPVDEYKAVYEIK